MRSKGLLEVVSFVQGHENSVYGYGFVIIAHETSCQPLLFLRYPVNYIELFAHVISYLQAHALLASMDCP